MKIDTFNSFEELIKLRADSIEIIINDRESDFLIFSPHGGGIEPGTSEICNWFNKAPYSVYMFNGKGDKCKELHITSTSFDEPKLVKLLSRHQYSISFHGMTDYLAKQIQADIYIGGLNKNLIKATAKNLNINGFSVKSNLTFKNQRLGGTEIDNITNRCKSNMGMQIEISGNLRQKFFKGSLCLKRGRKIATDLLDKFCNSIQNSINFYKQNGI
ncbi:MAG: poly-gamma-glutamate hydrolase family protein [Bacteroidetes bacterium]|nr:poly-gamma-glutamate hydrolase family protein [Bacteroidota bacterium]